MNRARKFRFIGWMWSGPGIVLFLFLGIAAFFLIAEHRAHLFGILPYALVALAVVLFLVLRWWQRGQKTPEGDPGAKEQE